MYLFVQFWTSLNDYLYTSEFKGHRYHSKPKYTSYLFMYNAKISSYNQTSKNSK